MQVNKAKEESDHLADQMELERVLKESKAEFCGANEDELQRVLKESSMDFVRFCCCACVVFLEWCSVFCFLAVDAACAKSLFLVLFDAL